jgi:hypothetical protein
MNSKEDVTLPSGGLTLIVGTKKGGFLAKYRGDPLRTSTLMKAYPQKPPADTMFMVAMAMVLP